MISFFDTSLTIAKLLTSWAQRHVARPPIRSETTTLTGTRAENNHFFPTWYLHHPTSNRGDFSSYKFKTKRWRKPILFHSTILAVAPPSMVAGIAAAAAAIAVVLSLRAAVDVTAPPIDSKADAQQISTNNHCCRHRFARIRRGPPPSRGGSCFNQFWGSIAREIKNQVADFSQNLRVRSALLEAELEEIDPGIKLMRSKTRSWSIIVTQPPEPLQALPRAAAAGASSESQFLMFTTSVHRSKTIPWLVSACWMQQWPPLGQIQLRK